MHDDEVDTDPSLVRRLVAAQFPEWADLPVQPVPSGGTDNALYRLGERMVVRLPRHERTNGTLEQEHRWLPKLAPLLPLPVPAPLARGMPAAGYPWEWSIYEWLDGETAYVAPIADSVSLATDLAQFVTALQQIDAAGGPPPSRHNAFRGVPLATRDEQHARVDRRAGLEDRRPRRQRQPGTPPCTHRSGGTLRSGSTETSTLATVLVAQGRLSAVIDWGCLGVGDPACDVAVAWKMLSAHTRDLFRTALSIDDATWARSRGWVLSQAVGALSYYTLETNPELVREGRALAGGGPGASASSREGLTKQ